MTNIVKTTNHWGKQPTNRNSRIGISTIETTMVMAVIIGVIVLAASSWSGGLSNTFEHTSQALESPSQMAANQASGDLANSSAASADKTQEAFLTLGQLALFATGVFSFMAYTVFFMSKAESGESTGKVHLPEGQQVAQPDFADSLLDRRSRIGRTLRDEMADFDCEHLNVAKFMTANPSIARESDPVQDVMNLMIKKGFRHLIILGDDGLMTGIISDRDLADVADKSVSQIMTRTPFHVNASTPIAIAITMFVKHRISALPVLEQDQVVGILTRSDLLVAFQCLLIRVQEKLSADARSPALDR